MRLVNGSFQRVVGVVNLMKTFVTLAHAVENFNRFCFCGRRNFDGLETTFERTVFFNRLAKLRRRGCADALNLAARKRRLQNVRRIERTFSRTRADQRVQLVDENYVLRILNQLAHDLFQALFKLAAIFCAGNDQRKVERKDALVFEERWHVAANDSLRQAFDDCGLANARFADQHRIVFGAAAKYLDHAFDLGFATDQRIEFVV